MNLVSTDVLRNSLICCACISTHESCHAMTQNSARPIILKSSIIKYDST